LNQKTDYSVRRGGQFPTMGSKLNALELLPFDFFFLPKKKAPPGAELF